MMLVGLVVVIVLSVAITAGAQMGGAPAPAPAADPYAAGAPLPAGGTAADAVAAGYAQYGMPFAPYGMDGPDAFSCSGLMRHILRTTGVDADAPWVPEEYLSRYAPVYGDWQPGDIVIYPDWATMYVGNGMLLNANMITGTVTETPVEYAGEPLGAVRPY